jgi:hypothetical protein
MPEYGPENPYAVVNSILKDAGITPRDLQGNQYTQLVNTVSAGDFDFSISRDSEGRPVINGLQGFGQIPETPTPETNCDNARFPFMCRAQQSLSNVFNNNPLTKGAQIIAGTKSNLENSAIRIGVGILGIGLVIIGFYLLAGSAVINVVSGGSGKTSDAVSNVKGVVKKGAVLVATKNPAAAAAA